MFCWNWVSVGEGSLLLKLLIVMIGIWVLSCSLVVVWELIVVAI